ncbi:FtsK/SpoIIIE family DNA translocase [Hoylesella nanceiensis]|jgi:stage III sporulation protein E|uniref:FtsK/SpoIIIE family DNA translocase n=1 Tax=Hoylesella nanceiensis TaxID=425941 RepID=UPI001CAD1DD1|nr:DNA translocase FtsK [Hoylesella nanceiensis]MBF1420731.1 DNA translocase FtsK 4TM domain-containing protein [Hoylesella nanceiensis]MBF1454987.1 DNA translocase FtsK 4TM domain-containing protein [Hoylesella nanceiensis]
MAKKKVDKKPQNISEAMGLQNIINNEKVDFVIGLFFVVCSIVLLIAFVSYFYTGKADQSILEDLRPGEWLNNDDLFQNKCRSLGAILSYYFITKEFGLAAFIIPFFFILIGLKMMKVYRISLWKWFLGCSLTMIWSSITLSKFLTPVMGDQVFNPGGGHGLFCVQHIENVIGTPGLIALLLITAIAFLTYLTSETINIIRKLLNPVKFLTDRIRFTVTNNEPEEKVAEQVKTEPIVEPVVEEPIKEEIREEEPAETVMLSPEITPTPAPKEKPEPVEKEDILTVEVASKTEEAKGSKLTIEEIMKTPINPKEPFTRYKYPTLSLLKKYDNDGKPQVDMDEIKANNARIVEVLNSFGVAIREIKATVGPTITLYEITPAEGVRISKIRNLEDDIALSLSALGIRIIAPIPGKGTIGIEVPNKKANIVSMESILNSKKFQETTMDLPLAIGKTITNEVYMVDLAKIPHLLVAGATGQGKSVGLNTIITSLLYKKHPNELKIVLVDPKKVEFSVYAPIADHFMATVAGNEDEPIITDVTKVVNTLNSLTTLMDARYDLLKIAGARNIKEYNQKFVNHQLDLTKGHEYMPYIVVIIDEYGDLIMTAGKEIELPITRIAQLARAVGIHMIIATQRPTANIITGSIKANFPGRMAFKVSSMTDSRTILDQSGANQLIGRGDMLILDGNQPVRVQCAFVDTPEIEVVNKYIAEQPGPQAPLELPEPKTEAQVGGIGNGNSDIQNLDPFFEEAAHAIVISQQGSTSMIQRRFSIGYNRAGRLMDQLQAAGIVGEAQGSKPRDVLITDENSLNILLAKIRS